MAALVQQPVAPPQVVQYSSGGFTEQRRVLRGAEARPVFNKIPLVDFSCLKSPDPVARAKLVAEVRQAARDVGFFYAVNTPVPTELMDEAFKVIEQFFGQSFEDKMRIHNHGSRAAKGYIYAKRDDGFLFRDSFTMGRDYTDREQWHISRAPEGSQSLNQWPDEKLPAFREVMYRYHNELHRFALQLVQIFALALGLEETALDRFFTEPLSDITVQHYPAQTPCIPGTVLAPHADHSAFTILLQNKVPSLQVLNPNSEWISAPPIDHAFVINTGNYMESWSNGAFPSTVHRVYNETGIERYSLPFFLTPNPSTIVQPLPELISPGDVAHFEPWNIGQRFLKGLFASKQDHPYVLKWRELGIKEEESLHYDMLWDGEEAPWKVI